MLEEAGDYFRYLPAGLEETNRKLDPLKYASLTLARRRDVGLPARSRILEIITASVTRYRNKFA
jgi:hypothetical protein